MKKYLMILLLTFSSSYAEQTTTQLAFIDNSPQSQQWLDNKADYLIKHHIPIMLIGGDKAQVMQTIKKYKGLLIGLAPQPDRLINLLLQQLGVQTIPCIVQTDTDNRIQTSPTIQ